MLCKLHLAVKRIDVVVIITSHTCSYHAQVEYVHMFSCLRCTPRNFVPYKLQWALRWHTTHRYTLLVLKPQWQYCIAKHSCSAMSKTCIRVNLIAQHCYTLALYCYLAAATVTAATAYSHRLSYTVHVGEQAPATATATAAAVCTSCLVCTLHAQQYCG